MSKKHKKIRKTLYYVEHILILTPVFTGYVSISAFASLVATPLGIISSAIGIKIYATTPGNKKYTKKKKKHDKIVMLEESKLIAIDILMSKALSKSYISHREFVSMNNVLKEYNKAKEETKNSTVSEEYIK